MSLIVTIFTLVFLTELVSWIGKSVLLDFAWGLYCQVFMNVPIYKAAPAQSRTAYHEERSDADLALKIKLEKLNSDLAATKTAFSAKFNSLIWILTTGLQFTVGWWYRKAAVFYLPSNWFGPITWTLALPFAPQGSVSVGVWQMACRRVIKVGEQTVKNIVGEYINALYGLGTDEFFAKLSTCDTTVSTSHSSSAMPVGARRTGRDEDWYPLPEKS
ncbi:CHD5-like protein-domain-containing protein [Chiua virens]|nr:CHD5-like protein-domain-containing protein [Chiua virens]